MRTVNANASDTELLARLSEWSDLMAAGDFTAATEFLHPPVDESGAETWSADNLRTYIENYGSWDRLADGARMQVTSIAEAKRGGSARHDVFRQEHRPPNIDFNLPLDGEWSDLYAVVDVVQAADHWAFVLHDLRVR